MNKRKEKKQDKKESRSVQAILEDFRSKYKQSAHYKYIDYGWIELNLVDGFLDNPEITDDYKSEVMQAKEPPNLARVGIIYRSGVVLNSDIKAFVSRGGENWFEAILRFTSVYPGNTAYHMAAGEVYLSDDPSNGTDMQVRFEVDGAEIQHYFLQWG